ncbi:hypothetical protein [Marinifilum flexuosum]|uniref:hypothetical protein n=1 Tax=Marinifilum flexuosum TaxID=1117708 RepID=UPI0011C4A3CD|nr:hypothetical protein [Marinifilum flexuosum]
MNKSIQIAVGFVLALIVSSCSFKDAIQFHKRLTNTKVESADFSSNKKSVHFIDMIHLGQQEFYDNVAQEVKRYKEDGYVLFYEWIDYETADTLTLRKTKKIVGMIPSKKGYSLMIERIEVEGVVFQENEQFMNQVNSLDFNVDITPQELIQEYENRHGEILLNNEDLQVPLYGDFNFSNDKSVMDIILNHRNKVIAEHIQNSKYDKIIVMYGADHQKGVLEELQKIDSSWKKLK